MDKIVYKIWDKKEGRFATSYSRAYHDEVEWDSKDSALNANCHGIFKDSSRYKIVKYQVEYKELS